MEASEYVCKKLNLSECNEDDVETKTIAGGKEEEEEESDDIDFDNLDNNYVELLDLESKNPMSIAAAIIWLLSSINNDDDKKIYMQNLWLDAGLFFRECTVRHLVITMCPYLVRKSTRTSSHFIIHHRA